MPIIRATTPTIRIRFSKLEIPDVSAVKAFYLTYTQKGAKIPSLSKRIYKSYESAKGTVISDALDSYDGATAEYTFNFTSGSEIYKKLGVTVASGAVSKIVFTKKGTNETVDVYDSSKEDSKWLSNMYKKFTVDHDDLSAYNTAHSSGLSNLYQKTTVMDFDPAEVEVENDCCYITRTLTQTQSKALIADADLIGTCDVVYEEIISGSNEHKRGTSKTFSDAVCNAELSDQVLNGGSDAS